MLRRRLEFEKPEFSVQEKTAKNKNPMHRIPMDNDNNNDVKINK